MRSLFLLFLLLLLPMTARAIDAPAAQVVMDAGKVLRGRFVEEHQMNPTANPLRTSGHFVVAPAEGLIWGIEKPFATSTTITPNGAAQNLGGLVMSVPMKNFRHLYDMVGGALAGDWQGLADDFVITEKNNGDHWSRILTPRPNGSSTRLPYASISVGGSHFVENIVLTKADGSYDRFVFTDAVLSSLPLAAAEIAAFKTVAH